VRAALSTIGIERSARPVRLLSDIEMPLEIGDLRYLARVSPLR
jgi:hypothetical protein